MSIRDWPRRSWKTVREIFRPAPGTRLRDWSRVHWKLCLGAVTMVAGAVTFDAWLLTCGFRGCPSAAEIVAYRPPEGGKVLDRRGRLIGRLVPINRVNVKLRTVPAHVQQAFIATEDRRFASHGGVDWRAFGRAVVRNVTSFGIREGFSTITMQAARNGFIPERAALNRSLGRKLIELRIARLLERHLTKDQILELYLNAIYLGNGVYGVEAASRDLFGKSVRQLTTGEGAMLAALPKAPSSYTPKRHAARARARRNLVLRLMHREGYLEEIALASDSSAALRVQAQDWRPPQPHESYALDAVRVVVDSVLRMAGERSSELVVHTTIDVTAQRAAERAVRTHAARIEGDAGWSPEGVQGAMVALDPRSGDVRALVGGRRYERGGFNRAVNGHRQPGSAFKPFVYAAALRVGYTPATLVDDEPVSVDLGEDVWTPANYGGEYRGQVTLRQALAQSANAATVRVSRAVGERRVVDAARRNGIASDLPAVPALALGAVEVTPLELVAAYSPFANGGFRVRPRLVRKIERPDGALLWAPEPVREAVMDPRDAFQVTSMLRSAVDEGTARSIRAMGVSGAIAGKTGTTNGGSDIWFVGYTPNLVAGFWFGYDTPRSLGGGANGGRYAAPAWADFYRAGWRERSPGWRAPEGIVGVDIDPETGKLADEWCPTRRREWFKAGTEPTETCDGHHDTDLIDLLMERWEGRDFKPLTRALRRLLTER
jgi:penicillin-binding protein 1A